MAKFASQCANFLPFFSHAAQQHRKILHFSGIPAQISIASSRPSLSDSEAQLSQNLRAIVFASPPAQMVKS
jgi:hypothetical protein